MMSGNVEQVRQRIEAAAQRGGRVDAQSVRILAATKYVDAGMIRQLAAAGLRDMAENRLESLVDKQSQLTDEIDLNWHFIGSLQSRKVADLARRVSMVHSLCTESAARRLAQLEGDLCPELLVQVNVDHDPGKDGVAPDMVRAFIAELPPALVVSGLMTMPSFAASAESSRTAFVQLRELRDALQQEVDARHRLTYLSMGTSQDFEVAVEEGATHVRLGRVLYAGKD